MLSLKHFEHIHFMLWSLIVDEIKSLMLKIWKLKSRNRKSRPEMFSKKGVLRNFTKFTEKHLYQGLRPATLLKKRLWHMRFPVNLAEFLRTPFLTEHLRQLLLMQFNT